MARIQWIKHRLENWALWKERESRGGLGFYTSSSFTWEVVDTSGYRELLATVDDNDAALTNQAVESLRMTKSHLYVTLQHIYPKNKGIKETARIMGRAESTIKANLEQADHAIRSWFAERSEKQQARIIITP